MMELHAALRARSRAPRRDRAIEPKDARPYSNCEAQLMDSCPLFLGRVGCGTALVLSLHARMIGACVRASGLMSECERLKAMGGRIDTLLRCLLEPVPTPHTIRLNADPINEGLAYLELSYRVALLRPM